MGQSSYSAHFEGIRWHYYSVLSVSATNIFLHLSTWARVEQPVFIVCCMTLQYFSSAKLELS